MNKNKPSVCGIGINDSSTPVVKFEPGTGSRRVLWKCPFYTKWSNMLNRCYNNKSPLFNNYGGLGVKVCNEWLLFSNFKIWMEEQNWEGKELDKDILGTGLLYCPENCCFVPEYINSLIIEERKNNKTGIPCVRKERKMFVAYVSILTAGKQIRKSFVLLEDAINFVADTKLGIVESFEIETTIKNALRKRYEKYRKHYLEITKNLKIGC